MAPFSYIALVAAAVADVASAFGPAQPLLRTRQSVFNGAPIAVPRRPTTRAPIPTQKRNANELVMMPIGVPKVAYRVPGSPQADWVDIYNRLYRERIIFLGQVHRGACCCVRATRRIALEGEERAAQGTRFLLSLRPYPRA